VSPKLAARSSVNWIPWRRPLPAIARAQSVHARAAVLAATADEDPVTASKSFCHTILDRFDAGLRDAGMRTRSRMGVSRGRDVFEGGETTRSACSASTPGSVHKLLAAIRDDRPHTQVSQVLVDAATIEIAPVLARFSTRPEGLTDDEARVRRAQYGPNVLPTRHRWWRRGSSSPAMCSHERQACSVTSTCTSKWIRPRRSLHRSDDLVSAQSNAPDASLGRKG
jgi:hypothetical protein